MKKNYAPFNNLEEIREYHFAIDAPNDYLNDEIITEDKRISLIKRMVRGFNKNIEKTKGASPETSSLTAVEKRTRKLSDLLSRWDSWKNLQ